MIAGDHDLSGMRQASDPFTERGDPFEITVQREIAGVDEDVAGRYVKVRMLFMSVGSKD